MEFVVRHARRGAERNQPTTGHLVLADVGRTRRWIKMMILKNNLVDGGFKLAGLSWLSQKQKNQYLVMNMGFSMDGVSTGQQIIPNSGTCFFVSSGCFRQLDGFC